ncbi:hypothetical protein CsSME_00013929 [Camellia sinensis var. sinensis]
MLQLQILLGSLFQRWIITLRRWRKGQPIESWEAHKAAIQAVIKLFSGELVTGVVNSNTMRHGNLVVDTTLKLWKGRTCAYFCWAYRFVLISL